jgi:hypothetical protein
MGSPAGPGDPRARAAALMGSAPLLGEGAKRAQVLAEAHAGMRCGGCRERIGIGLHFTVFKAEVVEGHPTMTTARLAACSRPDCDYAEECRRMAPVAEMVEFVWFDEALDDAGKRQPQMRPTADDDAPAVVPEQT